jgi:hypothetical protein
VILCVRIIDRHRSRITSRDLLVAVCIYKYTNVRDREVAGSNRREDAGIKWEEGAICMYDYTHVRDREVAGSNRGDAGSNRGEDADIKWEEGAGFKWKLRLSDKAILCRNPACFCGV